MHDEFRVQVHTKSPAAVVGAVKDLGEREAHRSAPRLVITHKGEHVFMYADSLEAGEHAREIAQQALGERGIVGEVELMHWHPVEERWEDAAKPLPATDPGRAAEHARLEQTETEESAQAGAPEWEVYITLPSHHDARTFAARLRGDGIPVKQLWHHLLVGANDEDDADALVVRLRAEAPPGSELHAQLNGLTVWRTMHPYAYLGGIAN